MVTDPPTTNWDPQRAFELKISDWAELRVALLAASAGHMSRVEATRWVKLMQMSSVRPRDAVAIIGVLRAAGLPPEALRATDVHRVRDRSTGERAGLHRCQFSKVRTWHDALDVLACLGAKARHGWPRLVNALAARRLYATTLLALAGISAMLLLGAAKCEEGDTHPSAPRQPNVRDRQPAAPQPTVPDPHAGDPHPHEMRNVTIKFRVGTKEQLPATVHISTLGGGVTPATKDDVIADTHQVSFTLVVDINAPTPLNIVAQLITSKGGTASWCSIDAGKYGQDGPRFTGGKTVTTCYLTIKRPQ